MVCLVIATVFWVFTSLSRIYETILSLPVQYRNLPFARYPDRGLPTAIDFHFKGTGFELARLNLRNIPDSIIVDLAAFSGYPVSIQASTLALRDQLPGDLKAIRVSPDQLSASFIQRLSKKVPVILEQRLSFSSRFALTTRPILRPDSIEIAGQPDVLSRINAVHTQTLTLTDIRKSLFGAAVIDTGRTKGVSLSKDFVFYYLPVSEYTEGIVEIPVELPVAQRSRITLLPEKVRISYLAPLQRFPNIRPSDFRVSAQVPFPEPPAALGVTVTSVPYGVREVKVNPPIVDYLVHE